MKKLGLALGGGAARGLAHIGVLEALTENGFQPHGVAGTSAGSLVGALYAAGRSIAEMKATARKTSWSSLLNPVVPRMGFSDHRRLYAFVQGLLSGARFEDLRLPLAVTATDLVTGREEIFTQGDVALAVTASCAIPGIFNPVIMGDRMLADGGLVDNVPTTPARKLGAEVVVAVDLGGGELPGPRPENVCQVLLRSLEIMQSARSHGHFAADMLVQPRVQHLSPIEFDRAEVFWQEGYRAMSKGIRELKSLLDPSHPWWQTLARRVRPR